MQIRTRKISSASFKRVQERRRTKNTLFCRDVVVLPRSKCHPTCLNSASGCAKYMLFCRVPTVILRVLSSHPDAQRRCCFAAFHMSSYVSYLVIRMHKEDVVLPRSNFILRVLPSHPDAKRRQCFAAFRMSSYVSYLVIRMQKEDVVLPRSKGHPTCLTSSSRFTKKTLFCSIPNVILRVLPRHPDAQEDDNLPRSKCHPTCLTSSSGCEKRRCFAAVKMSFYSTCLT